MFGRKNIHKSVKIWPFTQILDDTTIAAGTVIGSCCFIGKHCRIGKGVHIQHGAFIPHKTVIEDFVFIGPNVVLTDDVRPRAGKPYIPEPPVICRGASIGAGAVICPGVRVGEGAMIGAGSVVTSDVVMGDLVVGVPGKPVHNVVDPQTLRDIVY